MSPFDPRADAPATARAAMPERAPGEPLFLAPWHARAFALVVGLVEAGRIAWPTFQRRLVAELDANGAGRGETREAIDGAYFDAWLRAAERTLLDAGFTNPADVDAHIDALRAHVAVVRADQRAGGGGTPTSHVGDDRDA